MIAKLESKTEYGKMEKTGINLLPELSAAPVVSFAHGVQEALDWAKEFPLYQDAIVDDFGNGVFLISSQWKPREISAFEASGLVEFENGLEKAEYQRESILITPVNTIHENTGFFGYKVFKNRE